MGLTSWLPQEYNVDFKDSFDKRTVYIKTPMRFEDFGEEEKAMLLTTNYIRDHTTLSVQRDNYAMVYHIEAAFQVSKTEPKLKASAVVQMINTSVDSERLQDAKEKLADILIHKVQTYYEVQKHKEEKNMGSTGISWKETFSEEEKNMSLSAWYCDDICKRLGLTTKTSSVIPYCDETYEGFGSKTKTPTPANKSKWLEGLPAVKKVETYNDRVVKVTFIDGTFTKAVCSENDNFDLDMGITICAMKRLLGTNSDNATREYNRFINHVHSVMEKNTLDEVAEEARQAKEKSKQRKAELKRAAKKLKAKEEAIDIQKQAIIRAHQEMGAMDQ